MNAVTSTAMIVAPLLLFLCNSAQAGAFGNVTLTSDNIERGVSQSERKPALAATLGLGHAKSKSNSTAGSMPESATTSSSLPAPGPVLALSWMGMPR